MDRHHIVVDIHEKYVGDHGKYVEPHAFRLGYHDAIMGVHVNLWAGITPPWVPITCCGRIWAGITCFVGACGSSRTILWAHVDTHHAICGRPVVIVGAYYASAWAYVGAHVQGKPKPPIP